MAEPQNGAVVDQANLHSGASRPGDAEASSQSSASDASKQQSRRLCPQSSDPGSYSDASSAFAESDSQPEHVALRMEPESKAAFPPAPAGSGRPPSLGRSHAHAAGERFLEVQAPVHQWKGGVAEDLTTILRYTPSHVQYRSPPTRFGHQARIKLMVVVTMYAEAPEELQLTLEGIAENLVHMCADRPDAWREVVVVVVSDGIEKINNATFRMAETLGIARQGMIYQAIELGLVHRESVQMHTFSYAAQLQPSSDKLKRRYGQRYPPMQTMFCVKEHNGGKLDSHKWFFDAYCAQLNPTYVVLVDVGTRPTPHAICNLVAAMDLDSRVAGCCGEIAVALPDDDPSTMLTNAVVGSQVFEYKISHCMDKPLESWLGFITVLPGAFSAYRYAALTGAGSTDPSVHPPLQKYFASLHDPHSQAPPPPVQSVWDANMYLAEDRILCFEIVATKGKDYRLEYVKNAVAYTDVPLKLNLLLKQRRRWLNGSFFAMLHALANFPRIFITTTHSVWRKMLLAFELLYFVINVCITWFVLGSFYMVFKLVLANALPDTHAWLVVQYLLTFLYAFTTAVVFVLSIGNDPVWTRRAYRWCSISYALLFGTASLVQLVSLIATGGPMIVLVGALVLVGAYLFTASIHGQFVPVAATMMSYYVMLPTFANIFTAFSLCNIHDVSWGTKGLDSVQRNKGGSSMNMAKPSKPLLEMNEVELQEWDRQCQLAAEQHRRAIKAAEEHEQQVMHEYKWFRTLVVIALIASNFMFVTGLNTWVIGTEYEPVFTFGLAAVAFFSVGARVFGSVMFQLRRACCCVARLPTEALKRRSPSATETPPKSIGAPVVLQRGMSGAGASAGGSTGAQAAVVTV